MVSQFLPNNGMATATAAYITSKKATTGSDLRSMKRTPSPGQGTASVNKSKSPLRPRGRGRRVNSTSPAPAPPPPYIPLPFLKLPAEVRNQIYSYLLIFGNDLLLLDHTAAKSVRLFGKSVVMPNNHFVAPPALRQWDYDNQGHLITRECDCVIRYRKEDLDFIDQSLFLVNKQIYAETRSFLLAHNTLSLMPMDLHAMAPARWETILQLTHYDIGMDIDAMPQMVDFICSTVYELHDLRLVFVIPGFERTRCQYWVDKVKGLMEPLRDIHVRGQVEIRWIERHLVNNPEVRKETVKWFEKLGRDMMGGPGNGQPIVTGEKKKKEVTVALAGSAAVGVASAGSALVGSASAGTVLAGSASVGSASISATSVSSNSGSVSGGGSDGSSSG